jgi:hypothetical protein
MFGPYANLSPSYTKKGLGRKHNSQPSERTLRNEEPHGINKLARKAMRGQVGLRKQS